MSEAMHFSSSNARLATEAARRARHAVPLPGTCDSFVGAQHAAPEAFRAPAGSTEIPAPELISSEIEADWEADCAERARHAVPAQLPAVEAAPPSAAMASAPAQLAEDRRGRRRAMISAAIRVRTVNSAAGDRDEISTTIDVSRSGVLFLSTQGGYAQGMEVAVTFPYSKSPMAIPAEQPGRVARVVEMPDGRRAVAIALGVAPPKEEPESLATEKLQSESVKILELGEAPGSKRPLVIAVESDAATRESLKSYLHAEGYDVLALKNGGDAKELLEMFTPALLIAEIESEDMPGYDLCAHVKSTRKLRHIPVVLTTSSAYPSDYSNAHKMGAMVCMAKPYKQERLGHVVRLLAPNPGAETEDTPAPRKADPTRKACSAPHHGAGRGAISKKVYDESTSQRRKMRFPLFR